jgi:hypothetical protein
MGPSAQRETSQGRTPGRVHVSAWGGSLWRGPSFSAPPAVSMATTVAMVLLGKELVKKRVDPRPPCPLKSLQEHIIFTLGRSPPKESLSKGWER